MADEAITQPAAESKYTSHANTFSGFIQRWIAKDLGKKRSCRKYRSDKEMTELYYEGSGRNVGEGKDILAIRLADGRVIGNASKLERCGSYRKGDESPAQRVMFDLSVAMIPFNVFQEAKMDIRTVKVVEQGPEEDFDLPRLEWNYASNMLMPVQVRKHEHSRVKLVSDEKRKLINVREYENRDYVRDKNGNYEKNKDGSYKERKYTGYEFEYYDLTVLTKRHFVGAMLLKLKGKTYLFDVDRNELQFYRFNPFLSELPGEAKTITEAYDMLMPSEVKRAIAAGKDVKRQGEWFFIPTPGMNFQRPPEPKERRFSKSEVYTRFDLNNYDIYEDSEEPDSLKEVMRSVRDSSAYRNALPKYRKQIIARVRDYHKAAKVEMPKRLKRKEAIEKARQAYEAFEWGGELRAGNNRPNTVQKMYMDLKAKTTYVRGEVKHTGREHETIKLHEWHRAVPNTATRSFTITGNID